MLLMSSSISVFVVLCLMATTAAAVSISRIFRCFDNFMGAKLFKSFLVSNLFYGPSNFEISVMSVASFGSEKS